MQPWMLPANKWRIHITRQQWMNGWQLKEPNGAGPWYLLQTQVRSSRPGEPCDVYCTWARRKEAQK